MTQLHFELKVGKNLVKRITADTKKVIQKSVKTIAQDLARTASETAPHLHGDLEDSYKIKYQFSGDKLTATVEFAVFKGSFNYAIAMHEWTYKLGEKSQRKASGGGGVGMSGTSYAVGRKFLTRVLEGESKAYSDYIGEEIRRHLKGV